MTNYEIPYWKKYTLSIEEAAAYFRIGEGKLRKLVSEDPTADYILWNGNRVQIKRVKFQEYVDKLGAIQWAKNQKKKSKKTLNLQRKELSVG